eukprot:scaffold4067_cov267-Pinguiococcus_pyrenoidosus.AAC.2
MPAAQAQICVPGANRTRPGRGTRSCPIGKGQSAAAATPLSGEHSPRSLGVDGRRRLFRRRCRCESLPSDSAPGQVSRPPHSCREGETRSARKRGRRCSDATWMSWMSVVVKPSGAPSSVLLSSRSTGTSARWASRWRGFPRIR